MCPPHILNSLSLPEPKYRRQRGATVSSYRFLVPAPFNAFCRLKGSWLSSFVCVVTLARRVSVRLVLLSRQWQSMMAENPVFFFICQLQFELITFSSAQQNYSPCPHLSPSVKHTHAFCRGCGREGRFGFPNSCYIFEPWVSPTRHALTHRNTHCGPLWLKTMLQWNKRKKARVGVLLQADEIWSNIHTFVGLLDALHRGLQHYHTRLYKSEELWYLISAEENKQVELNHSNKVIKQELLLYNCKLIYLWVFVSPTLRTWSGACWTIGLYLEGNL